MDFSYFVALYNWKRNSAPKGKLAILGLKLLLTIMGMAVTTIFLVKIYEVPVNRTNICIRYNADSITANIKIVRDFDLRSHISQDTITSNWDFGTHSGYVYYDIISYIKKSDSPDTTYRGNMSISLEDHLRKILKEKLETKGKYHFIDSISTLLYVKTYGTWRQLYKFKNNVPPPTFEAYEYCCDTTDCNTWYCSYSKIHSKTPHNYYIDEDVYTCGANDTILKTPYRYYNSSFDKPNIFMTAEDFSKLIEEVHFDSLDSKTIHRLDIDYKGTTEFGVLIPKPDSITISSIHYYTPEKINQIAKNGLKYQIRLPEMENMQEVRIFFATMVLAGLLGVFFSILYRLFKPWGVRIWQKKSQNIISWVILLFILLFIFIAYCIFISRPATKNFEELPVKPFAEINT